MSVLRDRKNERYGRLLVVARADNTKAGKARWVCKCDCGNEVTIVGWHLQSGNTTSCGCAQRDATSASNRSRIKHGHTREHKTSPEWRSWKAMHNRCELPSMPNYNLYGGRGIRVCDEWSGKGGFAAFFAHIGPRPRGTSLDRIDVNGNYEPGNVRWASAAEQAQNRRKSPERDAAQREALDRGRERMWSDPEIRARLIAARRRKKAPNA